ncbi:MAG: tetratricopeptide repeat protein [Granulosicoccus sp.]
MKRMTTIVRAVCANAFLAISVAPMSGLASNQDVTALGSVSFPTTCSEQANATFQEGLTLLHHMMYVQAEAIFNEGIEQDDNCAMLYWGVAMANFHPLWPGQPSTDETKNGSAAADKLAGMTNLSAPEAGLVDAVVAFYSPADASYRERVAYWADAMHNSYGASQNDLDTAAFYALSLLATAPRGDKSMEQIKAAGTLLEKLHDQAPQHPGVVHYAIHAYDNPLLAEKGLRFAQMYDQIAPSVPHALHMPSHIFVRLGYWDETIKWNRRSADAAIAQSHGDFVSGHFSHAMDYGIYAQLQTGDFEKAQESLEEFLAIANLQPNFGSAYALAASPARVLLEQGKWSEAADLPDTLHPAIPWDKFPQCVSMNAFARGIGAIRSGDIKNASNVLEELADLHATLDAKGLDYWKTLTEAQVLSIEAWREFSLGNKELAVTLQAKAADMEDNVGKSPVTPGHVLPARELLGDLLTEMGDEVNARIAYETTLSLSPNRRRSVLALQ